MAGRSLRERLGQFDRTPTAGSSASRASAKRSGQEDATLNALLDRGARWVGGPPTGYLRFERALDATSVPGAPYQVVPPEAWYRLGGVGEEVPRPWAVVDTETTGLESGVGILVFLVGVVYWDDAGARLVQYFLPEPAGEAALLRDVAGDLERAGAILSYNGKSFDLPRLAARLGVNRIDASGMRVPHLDLLYPCRRLLRGGSEDCRLAAAEWVLLGRARGNDLPGWEVPEVYRAFLVDGVDRGLGRVFDHNEQDVRSLPWIAAKAAAAFLAREPALDLPGPARLAVARTLEHRSRGETAEIYYRWAARDDAVEVRRLARWHLALLHRRRGAWSKARRELEHLLVHWPAWIEPRVELAKLLEHRQGDLVGAIEVVQGALSVLDTPAGGAVTQRRRTLGQELRHRLERLLRKRRAQALREPVARPRL